MTATATTRTAAPAAVPPAAARRPVAAVAGVAVVAAALVAYPHVFTTAFARNVGVIALTFAIAATGWNLLGGYTGQVSFGHAVFFGTGMYTTAILVTQGWSPWVAMLPAALIAAVLAVLIGLPTFRLRGHYFSIATIAVGEITLTVVNDVPWLGGPQGISPPIAAESVWNMQFSLRDKTAYYYVVLLLFAVATLVAWLFVRGWPGRYVRAIRDDDQAAAAVGIPVRRYKLVAAALSAAITAMAGTFQVMHVLFVDPPSALDLTISIQIALIAVLGGAGSLWGPLLGAWVLIFLQQYTSVHWSTGGRPVDLLLYGALIAIMAVVEPAGLVGLLRRATAAVRRRLPRKAAP